MSVILPFQAQVLLSNGLLCASHVRQPWSLYFKSCPWIHPSEWELHSQTTCLAPGRNAFWFRDFALQGECYIDKHKRQDCLYCGTVIEYVAVAMASPNMPLIKAPREEFLWNQGIRECCASPQYLFWVLLKNNINFVFLFALTAGSLKPFLWPLLSEM